MKDACKIPGFQLQKLYTKAAINPTAWVLANC